MRKLLVVMLTVLCGLQGFSQQEDFTVPTEEGEALVDPNQEVPAVQEVLPDVVTVPPTVPSGVDPALEGFVEDNNYAPQDKRDPFFPFLMLQKIKIVNEKEQEVLEPLQQFALNELKVIGIIWDVGKPKALVVDPKGKSHIISESAKLGKDFGYVAAIREGEVIIIEEQLDTNGKRTYLTKILKMSNSAGTAQ